VRGHIDQPLALDVGHGADVVAAGQHKLMVQRPAWCGKGKAGVNSRKNTDSS
jgi:hypothetical protein